MKQLIFLTAVAMMAILSNSVAFSQKKQTAVDKSKVVATVGKEKITYQQLEKAFQKNMNRKNVNLSDVPKDSVLDFLNLYINYRLKVNDAIKRGFHTESSVLEDLNTNRRVLAESFYYEKMLTEPRIEKWLEMREKEYKVAVIITAFAPDGDTTAAYKKITDARNELNKGEYFGTVAERYSDDPETARNGGVVNTYITSGRVNREIESAVYSLKKDEFTRDYIRTKFGYFLVKVLDVQPRKNLKLRTMYIDFHDESSQLDSAMKFAKDLVAKIRSGKSDFATIAKEHSKDAKTGPEGGLLSEYYTRSLGVGTSGENFLPQLEDAIYKLKAGEVTDPIQVQNTIHIFKIDEIKPIDKLAEKDDLRSLYRRLYFNEDKKILLDSLAKVYGFRIHNDVFKEVLANIDSTKTTLDSAWSAGISESLRNKNIYTLNNKPANVAEFIKEMSTKPDFRGTPLQSAAINASIARMIEPKVFDYATENLENDFPEFEELVREFRDGILLFKVEALEVWDKMKFDTTIARKYYDTTTIDLTRAEMYDISEIFLLDETSARELYSRIKSGDVDFEKAANENTQRVGARSKNGYIGLLVASKNNLAELAKKKGLKPNVINEPISFESGYSIIRVNKIEPSRRKTFEEAVSDIAPRVQDIVQKQLTSEWLDRVRKDFPVKIENKTINSLLK